MEKNIQQEKDKVKPVFYDPKGRRNIAFISFLCISIVSLSIVLYFTFSFKVFFQHQKFQI